MQDHNLDGFAGRFVMFYGIAISAERHCWHIAEI